MCQLAKRAWVRSSIPKWHALVHAQQRKAHIIPTQAISIPSWLHCSSLSNSPILHHIINARLSAASPLSSVWLRVCFAKNQMQFPPSPPSPTARSMSVGCVGWWAGGGVNYLVRNRDRKVETLRDMFRPPFFFQMRKKGKKSNNKGPKAKKKKKK